MKRASGVGHLTPFLPGLETLLEDGQVSEIMINGPGNVWVEREGRLEPHEAPELTAAWLHRAAIHIARPLGLDPAARPVLDARLEDGSRVAICTPPASPEVAITIRRFGGRAFSAEDLVRLGSLPEDILEAARSTLASRPKHPGLRRHGLGQDHAPERADRTAALGRADRRDRGHARTQDRPDELPPVRGRGHSVGDARRDPRPGAPRAAPPARPHRRRRGPGRRGRRSLAGAQHRTRRVAHDHPRQQRALRAVAARELRHAGRGRAALGRSPAGASSTGSRSCCTWPAARAGGSSRDALEVCGYDAAMGRWITAPPGARPGTQPETGTHTHPPKDVNA